MSPDPAHDLRLLDHVRWLIERDEQAAATFTTSAGVIAAGLVAEVAILVDKGAGSALWWLALPAVLTIIAIAPRRAQSPTPPTPKQSPAANRPSASSSVTSS